MSNKLQGWLASNTLTEDPNDRILILFRYIIVTPIE